MSLDQYEQCPICCTDLAETKSDVFFRWASRLLIASSLLMAGAAFGFVQGATYLADQAAARFDCVAKP